jgi:histidine kinase
MFKGLVSLHRSLISRLIVLVGFVLLLSISIWAYFTIDYQKKNALKGMAELCDRLGTTVKLGAHYAMTLNSRDDINEITKNIGRQEGIENIRIYNKQGEIKFSNKPEEVDTTTTIKAEACDICHRNEPPAEALDLSHRTRIFQLPGGPRLLGVISPIYNEPGCATETCHVHPQDKKVLGAVDLVVSLKETDASIKAYESRLIVHAIISFFVTSTIIGSFLIVFLRRPIKKLISWTNHIAQGRYHHPIDARWNDEIGQLAGAISSMGKKIGEKQNELNKQRDEYQKLFEEVPCYITVQDRDLRMLTYNRAFASQFSPRPGEFCFEVYKGQTDRCAVCPVLETFEDGRSHSSEQTGLTRDGKLSSWICRTTPLRDSSGAIAAVMEMSVDVTERKDLEEEIRKSEQKYREIFNNIPNPIFVLDCADLKILDVNDIATATYGFSKAELAGMSFLELFQEEQSRDFAHEIRNTASVNQVRQRTKDGRAIFVNIRISPSEYLGRETLLVSTSDITKRLMAEQHLIQASKMATLGEMATGIAHELNQPLSVIKTASSFIVRKISRDEAIKPETLRIMAEEIDSHVDRASQIINHLREFGRKSEVEKERVNINEVIKNALEIFIQQLKLRKIEVVKDFAEDLPPILGNANRLEQVFINLLINARDAIEAKSGEDWQDIPKQISLSSRVRDGKVTVQVKDTGTGIPKSVLDRIYEPFFTTKQVGKGTGLGLSISYGIVQDYEGTIQVETKENEGSNFIIEFPASSEAP